MLSWSGARARATALAASVAFTLLACGPAEPPPSPRPDASISQAAAPSGPAAPPPAGPDGWEDGPAALESALSGETPVLLYVRSEWCPPCRALDANVLSRPAFIDATKGLRRVRIDGDADGAQAVIERFEARAYPTLLLLSPRGEELFRAHHAISLDELSPALAAAAASGSGFEQARARLGAGAATLADCTLLAAVDWGTGPGMALSTEHRLTELQRAVDHCGSAPAATRGLLASHLLGLAATADLHADSALPGAGILPRAGALLDAVFADDEATWAARTLITTWVKPVVGWVLGGERGPRFAVLRDRWLRAAAAIRLRPGAPLDVQLLGYNAAIDLHALEHGEAPLPAPLRAEIEAAVARVSALARTSSERHAVVPEAAYLLRSTGRRDEARAMLLAEIATGDAPSHHQTTLSQWALADGDRDAARRFARDAVTSARGRASRLQWMVNELSLYSTDPLDRPRLLELAADVYRVLFERDDAFLGRNHPRAARLVEILGPLRAEAAVRALVERHSPRCSALPAESREPCHRHFAALR